MTPDPTETPADSDDTLVLPESALDDALDTVRTGADEYEDVPTPYTTGLVDGAEQMHHLLTNLDLSDPELDDLDG